MPAGPLCQMAGKLKNSGLWPFGKSNPRRREVRRGHNGHARSWGVLRQEIVVPSGVLGLMLAGLCLTILYGATSLSYRVGQRIDRPIVARVDFTFDNPVKAATDQMIAKRGTPNYYRVNEVLRTQVEAGLDSLTKALKDSPTYADFQARCGPWQFSEAGWQYLQRLVNDRPDRWQQVRDDFVRRLLNAPIINSRESDKREPKTLMSESIFIAGGKERRDFGIDLTERDGLTRAVDTVTYSPIYSSEGFASLSASAREGFRQYLRQLLAPPPPNAKAAAVYNPIYTYDSEETVRRMELAAKAVNQTEMRSEGDILVTRNGTITDSMLDMLRAEQKAYIMRLQTDPALHTQYLLHELGMSGVVLATVLGLVVYTLRFRPQLLQDVSSTIELAVLLLLAVGACRWLAISGISLAERWAIIPVWLLGSILALATQQRYAVGVTFATALLAVLALQSNGVSALGTYVVLVGTTLVAIALLGDIRTRTRLAAVGIVAGSAGFALSFFVDLAMMQPIDFALSGAVWAGLASLAACLLLQFLLPLLERFFGIVTGMTLLEWCDINKPLLRRLAREAPGTYNHALVLGSMAEAAAESIGAQGLLTRVGAYYHDIGKINKPRYFVENQQAGANWHDRLSPTMSLLIIIGHVKDGLELAREYGLPRALWPFIGEHHGTTLVRYFYRQAADRNLGQQLAESDFRYPGPKPRSRETAILMLSDSVESAVRTLSEPTPGRIEGLVHQMVMDRLTDGQFEECDITLREIHRVEESIVKSLCAIYHGRIAYPAAPPKETPRPKPAQAQTA